MEHLMQQPVAWLIEFSPETGMVDFATVMRGQADRIAREYGDRVEVTPLFRPEAA